MAVGDVRCGLCGPLRPPLIAPTLTTTPPGEEGEEEGGIRLMGKPNIHSKPHEVRT